MAFFRPVFELGFGVALLLGMMTVHGFGMYATMHRFEVRWPSLSREPRELLRQIFFGQLVIMMICTHLLEILSWALILKALAAFPDIRTAFYFSGETYTTVGFGDVLLPHQWRQLGLFIALSGLFSFGWTTGVLVGIVGKAYEVQFSRLRKPDNG